MGGESLAKKKNNRKKTNEKATEEERGKALGGASVTPFTKGQTQNRGRRVKIEYWSVVSSA